MIERGTTFLSDRSAWLKHVDKRSPTPSLGDDIVSNTHTMVEESLSYSPGDSALKNTMSVDQDESQFFFDRVLSSVDSLWSTGTRRDSPMFELPRQPLLSIGQLQHLYIHDRPPYSIGNPWGGTTWNRLFDDYFLSGIQTGISEPDFTSTALPVLPHPRLVLSDPEDLNLSGYTNTTLSSLGEDVGLAMKVEGAFNINSTSVDAWLAVLGGLEFSNFTHVDREDNLHDDDQEYDVINTNNEFPAAFTRFPQSIQELFDVNILSIDSRDEDRPMLQMKPGITFVYPRTGATGEDSDFTSADHSRITAMAQGIVEGIKARTASVGSPYPDLQTFLTEIYQDGNTLLEHVLEEEGVRKVYAPSDASSDAEGLVDAEERTPGWLSQADLISSMAPFLTVRSDTFTIRAFGEAVDEAGNPTSQIWCEAVIQRRITPVEEGLTLPEIAAPLSSAFGREFEILSFTWLTESEI